MIIRYVNSLLFVVLSVLFSQFSIADNPVAPINNEQGVALKGYDAVAYFEQHMAVQGEPAFNSTWDGVKYFFASAAHRDLFIATPEKYQPQYGGYCSYAMSKNLIADINPMAWAIVDGKLYLNNNKLAHSLWSLDKSGNIKQADINWPSYPKLNDAAPKAHNTTMESE